MKDVNDMVPRLWPGEKLLMRYFRTTILGNKVKAPFFISPCSRGALGNPDDKEKGLVEGAAAEGILYMVRTNSRLPL